MKNIFIITSILMLMYANANAQQTINFYDFKVETLEGGSFDFSDLKGKKVLIVNTASKCGLTPQYEELERLYKEFGNDKFVILGFPANNFFSQEPGSNDQIAEFCKRNYGVSFPMMAKISVKGKDMHPLYKWLTSKELNKHSDSSVSWNFQKYLINEDGSIHAVISPKDKPYSKEILDWLKNSH